MFVQSQDNGNFRQYQAKKASVQKATSEKRQRNAPKAICLKKQNKYHAQNFERTEIKRASS
jgi:hypothetical protein